MWIINLLAPAKYDRFIDIFGGSGTVTLNIKRPNRNSRIYNDYNNDLVNLITCAKENTLALVKEIGFLALNSRADFEMCKKFIEKNEFNEEDLKQELALTEVLFDAPTAKELREVILTQAAQKDIKRAAIYYKMLRYSFNANGKSFGGRKCDVRRFFVDIWNFSYNFADVTIENKDFASLIKYYDSPKNFLYADPPYYNAEKFYEAKFYREDHTILRDLLRKAKSYVMVSYNNVPEITDLYRDFYIYRTTRPHAMRKKKGEVYEELLITNYDPSEYIQRHSYQTNLFASFFNFHPGGSYELIHQPEKPLKSKKTEETP